MRDFDSLEPQGFEFTYKKKQYVLREAPESTVIKYKSVLAGNAKFNLETGKLTEINQMGLVGLDALIVAGCTFEIITDRNGKLTGEERPVLEAIVHTWPHPMIEELAIEAEKRTPALKRLGAGTETEEAEKNVPEATRNGSTPTYATATN